MKPLSKEIKIGATFIISIALLYIGVNFLKGSNVFSHDNTYYMVVSNAGGVAPSSVINTNGLADANISRAQTDSGEFLRNAIQSGEIVSEVDDSAKNWINVT